MYKSKRTACDRRGIRSCRDEGSSCIDCNSTGCSSPAAAGSTNSSRQPGPDPCPLGSLGIRMQHMDCLDRSRVVVGVEVEVVEGCSDQMQVVVVVVVVAVVVVVVAVVVDC